MIQTVPQTAEQLASLLFYVRYHISTEADLQADIEKLLRAKGIPFEREYPLDKQSRIDFLIDSGIGVEVKIGSTLQAVQRQLWRYAKHDKISGLILVTTRSKHLDMPSDMIGKPLYVVYLLNSFL